MLVAFSASWVCSIYKMLSSRRASGKSLYVVALIGFGYFCGITSKLMNGSGEVPPIIFFYALNSVLIAFDAWLVIFFSRWEKHLHPLEQLNYTRTSA